MKDCIQVLQSFRGFLYFLSRNHCYPQVLMQKNTKINNQNLVGGLGKISQQNQDSK
jgi:hypothetical protein